MRHIKRQIRTTAPLVPPRGASRRGGGKCTTVKKIWRVKVLQSLFIFDALLPVNRRNANQHEVIFAAFLCFFYGLQIAAHSQSIISFGGGDDAPSPGRESTHRVTNPSKDHD